MKKIRSYTSIWNVEKVLYAINDVNLPFPVTFTQITWFVLTEFIIILFADVPPLSMIEGAFLKYFGIPVALTWFMSQKTFDGKKPYSYIKTMVLYAINDVNLPFPVTFTQITWFVLTEFIIILFADVPPLSMIEGAFLKYFGIPVALTWFMSQKTFDGKKPYSYIKTMVLYALRPKVTYAGKAVNLHKQKFEETITAVRSVTYVPD